MEELLRALLLAGSPSPLAALVGDRVQWGSRDQASGLPAVTLIKISGGPGYADDGEVGLDEIRVQIDCWASTFSGATALARVVRDQISAYHDNDFRHIALDASRDLREGGSNQADYEFRTSMDFIILHRSV